MNTEELYKIQSQNTPLGQKARQLLAQTHWFSLRAVFDPKSGEALTQALSPFLEKVDRLQQNSKQPDYIHDRLWRITEHCRAALEHLMFSMNESSQRDHSILPIRDVRELDANCFIKICNRPGRNIREKLAGKPYLEAVRRFQSVNLPENRLLKAFVSRLEELLLMRVELLGEMEDPLLPLFQKWLRLDEVQAIARWENLPPNNTLLSHRDYRRVWDSWRWLQSLDDDVANDFQNVERRQKTIDFWVNISKIRHDRRIRMAEVPVLFDYDKFEISSWTDNQICVLNNQKCELLRMESFRPFPTKNEEKISLALPTLEVPVCVDFTDVHPVYSEGDQIRKLSAMLVWQNWSNARNKYELSLFQANAACYGPDITTITSSDLFFSDTLLLEDEDHAAMMFARNLHEVFHNDTFIWLVPDILNDFELEGIRRNVNAIFANAEPLPRSVAAVFQHCDFAKIHRDHFSVLVIDSIGGKKYATKLVACHSEKLEKKLPATRGFTWERHPPILLNNDDYQSQWDFDSVNLVGGEWTNCVHKNKVRDFENSDEVLSAEKFDLEIHLTESPVSGGILVHELQNLAGDIALWRDHLPELSTKIPHQGFWNHFYFVKDAHVAPKRGMTTQIPIRSQFILSAGQSHYEFPLYQGNGKSMLKFVALLKSPSFPLSKSVQCSLQMTYTYGADNPYELTFVPDSRDIRPIRVEWRSAKAKAIDPFNLPVPIYPRKKTWEDFRAYPEKSGEGTRNLLEWVEYTLERLDVDAYRRRQIEKIDRRLEKARENRVCGIVQKGAKDEYFFVDAGDGGENVYCRFSNVIDGSDDYFETGQNVYLTLMERDNGQRFGVDISFYEEFPRELEKKILNSITNQQVSFQDAWEKNAKKIYEQVFSIRFPTYTIWNEGHSISEAPGSFRDAVHRGIRNAVKLINNPEILQELREELFHFLCCIHKDAPELVPRCLTACFSNKEERNKYSRHIAYAIGDASLPWQKELLKKTIIAAFEKDANDFAFEILSIVAWRNERFVSLLVPKVFAKMGFCLYDKLCAELKKLDKKKESVYSTKKIKSGWLLSKFLELLLALIRTRQSSDSECRELFIPGNSLSNLFVDVLERLTQIMVEEQINLKSRIQLHVDKPQEFAKTPDLLYALHMYLTGDADKNTISIQGISEE